MTVGDVDNATPPGKPPAGPVPASGAAPTSAAGKAGSVAPGSMVSRAHSR